MVWPRLVLGGAWRAGCVAPAGAGGCCAGGVAGSAAGAAAGGSAASWAGSARASGGGLAFAPFGAAPFTAFSSFAAFTTFAGAELSTDLDLGGCDGTRPFGLPTGSGGSDRPLAANIFASRPSFWVPNSLKGPISTMRPRSMTMAMSKSRMVSKRCAMTTMVESGNAAWIVVWSNSCVCGSMAEVASSNRSNMGLRTMLRAKLNNCRCPKLRFAPSPLMLKSKPPSKLWT
mmetsp:Transcript_18519/g.41953  ORF Transcript_18519/g.41953 Transcript_18519/m.41953 type:complete len:230 (+) Transcript_18519:158-847(+)